MTRKKITVLYGNELEGRLSAYIVKHFYRNQLEYDIKLLNDEIINHFNNQFNLLDTQDILYVIDLPINDIDKILNKCKKAVMIDNHDITNNSILSFRLSIKSDYSKIHEKIEFIHYEHSTVYNTFKYFDKESEIPLFIEYFDIWNSDRFVHLDREESLESLYFVNGLSSLIIDDYTIELLFDNDKELISNIISIGKAIYNNLHKNTEFYEGHYCGLVKFKSFDVLQYTYGLNISDIEDVYSLTCAYVYNGEKWIYNLHSKNINTNGLISNNNVKSLSKESQIISTMYYKYNFLEEIGKID